MREQKGFTLIELLAVIVILAVIALIATPIVMNVINNSRMGAFKDSAYGIIKAGEIKITKDQNATNIYTGEVIDLTDNTLSYKGTKPLAGALVIQSDGKMSLEMTDGEFCATKAFGSSDVIVKKKDNNACDGTGIIGSESNIGLPEVREGMIPITFDKNGSTIKADTSTNWYDYENKLWANAVSVTAASREKYQSADVGTGIAEADILGYFVWIPRYRYQLWNAEHGTTSEQEIQIEFENKTTAKSNGIKNGEWLTHPAFTFGNTELAGIWVGKFETTGIEEIPTVKPNLTSLGGMDVATTFYTIRKFSTTDMYGLTSYNAHLIKNSEWGVVAYLSHSKYGKNGEIFMNGTMTEQNNFITGCGGNIISNVINNCVYDYKVQEYVTSTTGNITGVYDMAGGIGERVMGVVADNSNRPIYFGSGFTEETFPEEKYYNLYLPINGRIDYNITQLGDATGEVMKKMTNPGGWYDDFSFMPTAKKPWVYRGGISNQARNAGLFAFHAYAGDKDLKMGSRVVLVTE